MISDRGFWDGGASGEEVKGMLGWPGPVEFELLGGSVGPEKQNRHRQTMRTE